MMKLFLIIIGVLIIVSGAIGALHMYRVSVRNRTEMAPYTVASTAYDGHLGKVLVIYYSLTEHTAAIAQEIARQTQGDLFRIQTQKTINRYPWFYLTLKRQLDMKNYPTIATEFPDISTYDTIFVGAPVWWYTVATPMLSFLNQFDFKGKTIVPFSTQGSNAGTFFADFERKARQANLKQGASFNNMGSEYDGAVRNKITHWLNQI